MSDARRQLPDWQVAPLDQHPPGSDTAASKRRLGWKRIAIVIGLIAVLVLAVSGWRWWHHPGVFYSDVTDSPSVGVGDARVGDQFSFGMSSVQRTHSRDRYVDVETTRPNILVNTANATVSVSICSIDTSRRIGTIGSIRGPLGEWCTRLVPATDSRMRVTGVVPDQMVMTIVPTKRGIVAVQGLDVTYGYGFKHGTERIGVYVSISSGR